MKQSRFNIFRRLFARKAALITLFIAILGCSGVGMAEFEEGKHYFKVNNAEPGTGDKVNVIEFF